MEVQMSNRTLAGYLYRMIKEERYRNQKYAFLSACKNTKIAKLWNILFETDIRDADILESRIYEFGSMIKEADIGGRGSFGCIVALVNLVIK